jgi:hypothetical protein
MYEPGTSEYEFTEIEENISALCAAVFHYPVQDGLPLISMFSKIRTSYGSF